MLTKENNEHVTEVEIYNNINSKELVSFHKCLSQHKRLKTTVTVKAHSHQEL